MTDDDSKTIELNRRRVLGGIVTVGAAAAAAGAGTFAAFSDTETSGGNEVTAGTLDLVLNDGSSAQTSIDINEAVPGEVEGYLIFQLTNGGTITGNSMEVSFTDTSSAGNGELDSYFEVGVYITDSISGNVGSNSGDYGGSGTEVIPDGTALTDAFGSVGVSESLDTSTTKYLVFEYALPVDTPNEAQGDAVSFDLGVSLYQNANQNGN